ncbi:ECF subfamily RNA polymerase sigma-24 subunit [Actinoplanes friuliensis DSM 7358]|uniref:ECF subfamily RNA polymerase sigma-24 subunit n=1 Tax=Actinoplanes friuliensis DSM 7358 TaxID=1246995 RepID=U5VW03_9ACTN|nr:ECF subfamily RNA polymerase sigma-24 subunit [Actinoplanes friuliensis DSM 7358]
MRSRRRVLAVAVSATVVAGLGVLGITTAMAADAGPIKGLGGKCVDVAGANSANGTAVQLWDCNGTGAQRWTVDGQQIQALGKCLDVTAASAADGAKVQLYACNNSGAQKWSAQGGRLVNAGSGKCLDATGQSSASGTRLQIWTCTGAAGQTWQVPGATTAPTTAAPTATQPPATQPPATGVKKKGVSSWEFAGVAGGVKDVGAGWYYNWGTNNDKMPADAEFVPMIWDETVVTAANLAKVKTEGTTLLGFNEPDLNEQAKMPVQQALDLWPQLQGTGMRLGSPAVAYGGDTPGGWLDQFMTGARQRNLKVDFITLHWYGSDFSDAAVGQFMGYVKAVHDRYQLPIWVTEFGLMNFSGTPKFPNTAQITAFIRNATAQLQSAPYVERYAWFSLPAVGDSVDYGLYRDATTPTEAGKAYRSAGS